MPDIRQIDNPETAKECENHMYSALCESIHKAAHCLVANDRRDSGPIKKHWWNNDCTLARNRTRLYHEIWTIRRSVTMQSVCKEKLPESMQKGSE